MHYQKEGQGEADKNGRCPYLFSLAEERCPNCGLSTLMEQVYSPLL